MLAGRMYLELDDGDRKQRLEAVIPRCIDREQEIAFEFNGDNEDTGVFQGKVKAEKAADKFIGDGQFRWADGVVVDATIRGKIEYFDGQVILEGQWVDESNGDAYDLFIEMEETE